MLDGWNGYIPWGYLFLCIGNDGSYIRLQSESCEFRADPSNFHPVEPVPVFQIGETVRLKKKPEKIRRVIRLHYHTQRKVIVYHVESSDAIGRTYWFEDQLQRVSTTQRP